MSDADALMWAIEKDPQLRSTIISVAVLDGRPDADLLAERMERVTREVPRLRQRVQSSPLSLAPPRWEVDPNFDLGYHLRWSKAPGSGSLRDLLAVAEPMGMQGFDRARPLWELAIVDQLEGGRCGVILKLHHAITDGVGAVKIGMSLFDFERDSTGPATPMPAAPEVHVMTQQERFVDAARHEGRRVAGIVSRLAGTASTALTSATADPMTTVSDVNRTLESVGRMLAPATTPLSPLWQQRSLSVRYDTIDAPLDELKAAARVVGGRLNDAFVAAVAGGVRRYHEAHGVDCGGVRMSMPINIRDASTGDVAGNQFAPARFVIPLDIADPAERMTAIRQLVAGQRAEPALNLAAPLSGVLRRLPTSLSTAVFGSMLRGVDLVTSNVPGIPIPVYLCGAMMERQWALGPCSGAAVNITLLSYGETVHVGINSDPAAVPDAEVFVACLTEGFDEIRKVA